MYDFTPIDNLAYHHSMLLDQARTGSFLKAILNSVRPGDVVLDIGSGTGILALFACLAGAKRVYAMEQGPVIEIARQVCRDNGFEDRVIFLQDWSTNIELTERADVLVSETIGNAGFEEGILGWIVDAKKRHLTPDARIIPRSLTLMAVPVENEIEYEFIDDWLKDFYSFDYSAVRSLAAKSLLQSDLCSKSFLGKPVPLTTVELQATDLDDDGSTDLCRTVTSEVTRDGIVHGIGAWFTAELIPGLFLSNVPPNRTPSWSQILFPLDQPIQVNAGDRLFLAVEMKANASKWEWQISLDKGEVSDGLSPQEPIKPEQLSLSGATIVS